MPSLSDLIAGETNDSVMSGLLSFFKLSKFPTAAWDAFALPRVVTEYTSRYLADKSALIAAIAKGGFLDLAEGAWLDLLAASLYVETRKPAVFAQGIVTFTDAQFQGPITFTAGAVWVGNTGRTRRFKAIASPSGNWTLPYGGTLDLLVEAEEGGADWNVGSGELVEVLTPAGSGIVVTNPPGTNGSWLTQQGADVESDPALRQRCRDKWATIGSGSNDAAYRYWATSTAAEVTRVKVSGDPDSGTVTMVIAGPTGPVSTDARDAVDARVTAARPLCIRTLVFNATGYPVPLSGVLRLRAGAPPVATLQAALDAVNAYARESDIGGVVYRSRLIAALHVAGVRSVELASPAGDIALASDRTFSPTFDLVAAA